MIGKEFWSLDLNIVQECQVPTESIVSKVPLNKDIFTFLVFA